MKKVVIKPTEFGIYKVEAYQISIQPDNNVVFGLMLTEKHRPGICHFRWGVKIMVELSEGLNFFVPVFNDLNPSRAKAGLRMVNAEGDVLTDEAFFETGHSLPWITIFPHLPINGFISRVEAREVVLNLGSDFVGIYFKPYWSEAIRRTWQLAQINLPTMMLQSNHLKLCLLMDLNAPMTSADLGLMPANDEGGPILIFPVTWAAASMGPVF